MKNLFAHPDGDHLTLLNVYHAFKSPEAQNDARGWCDEHFLSLRVLQSADNVRNQLARIMERNGLDLMSTPFEDKDYCTNIRRALVSGFFMQVAKKSQSGKTYVTVKDHQEVLIHPSTVLAQDNEWLVYNEFVFTTKNYIRTVTQAKPEWLLELAPMYYDLSTFQKSEVRMALEKTVEKAKRTEELSGGERSLGPHRTKVRSGVQTSSAHRPSKTWECDTCSCCFVAHMNRRGHWEHYCKPCKQSFVNENDLKMHLNSRVHRGTDVACPFCSRGFVTASGLASHLEASACRRAPVINRQSMYEFINSKDSRQLVTSKQLEWNTELLASEHSWNGYGFECYLCHNSYDVLSGLNTHLSNAHRQTIYHCPNRICPKEFVTLAALFNHLESESCGYTRFETVNRSVAGFFDTRRAIQF